MEISLLPLGHHHCCLSSLSRFDFARFSRASLSLSISMCLSAPFHFLPHQVFFLFLRSEAPLFGSEAVFCIALRLLQRCSFHRIPWKESIVGSRFCRSSATGINMCRAAEAVSTSRRALRGAKIPESDFTTLPNGLKYYDLKVGGGLKAGKGSRVAVHYVAKWRGVTFMTSRQGLGVTGGTPYGFDVGQSENGTVLKGLDLGVEGMRVGGQRLLIVPPELAYGSKGVQEIPPNATIELDVELLSIKSSPYGSGVKLVEG